MKGAIILLTTLALLTGGCAKKFKLDRDAAPVKSVWLYPRSDISARAAVLSSFNGELKVKWEEKMSDAPIAPMTIGGGFLIVPGSKRHIYFYDISSGDYLGKYNLKRNSQSGMVVSDSLGYFSLSPPQNRFICINLYSRKKLWSLRLKDVTGTPIIIDNRIYLASGDNKLFCLDKMTGQINWEDTLDSRSTAGPSGMGDKVVFPFDDGKIRAYKAESGDIMFEKDLKEPIVSRIVMADQIYLTTKEGSLYCIDIENGEIHWSEKYRQDIWTSPALDNNILYFADNGGIVRAVQTSTGSLVWQFDAGEVINSSPIIIGNFLLFGTLAGGFYCLDKFTGEVISRRDFEDEIKFPAVSNGSNVYMVTGKGGIHCFGE